MRDFEDPDEKEVYITPGSLGAAFMDSKPTDNTPLNLSTVADIAPMQTQLTPTYGQDIDHGRTVASKTSFSDRVHQLAQAQAEAPAPEEQRDDCEAPPKHEYTNFLAELEHEFDYDSAPSSLAPSRVGTGFSIFDRPERNYRVGTGFTMFSTATDFNSPLRQDTGLMEPPDGPKENEFVHHSVEKSLKDIEAVRTEEQTLMEKMWEPKTDQSFGFGEGVKGNELKLQKSDPYAVQSTNTVLVADPPTAILPKSSEKTTHHLQPPPPKPLEEKISNTTIRPAASSSSFPPIPDATSSNGAAKPSSSATSSSLPPPPPPHQQLQQHHHHDTKTAFEPLETPQYEHDYFQHLRTNSDLNYKRSQDLEDYLNMEIE